jgi:hypothetical protein
MDGAGLAPCRRNHRPLLPARRRLVDEPVRLSLGLQDDLWSRSIDPADRLKSPNAAMESFFTSLNSERTARKVYRTRDDARADAFD